MGPVGVAAALTAAAALGPPIPPAGADPLTAAPLAGGAGTGSGSWALLAVGELHDPLNIFWQLLSLPDGAGPWRLVTPPGVADNGGLTGDFPASGPVTIGFEPSQALGFSPLATSTDSGTHWAAGLVPSGLAAVPDALAASPGALVALVRRGGGAVLEGSASGGSWAQVATRRTLASVGGGCRPVALVAAAVSASGAPFVGATCGRRGRVGVYSRVGAGWQEEGPRLAAPLDGSAAALLRLTVVGQQLVGLAGITGRAGPGLVAFWRPVGGGPWTVSAPWTIPPASRLVASAVGPGPNLVVLLGAGGTAVPVSIAGPGQPWVRLPDAPAAAAGVAPVGVGGADAFTVHGSVVTVFSLTAGTTRWQRVQAIDVPVAYGSSG